MLFWRVLLGTLIIATLVGLCLLDAQCDRPDEVAWVHVGLPGVFLMPVLFILAVMATNEVLRLADSAGFQPLSSPIHIGNLLMLLVAWFPAIYLHYARLLSGYDMGFFNFILLSPRSPWVLAISALLIFIGEIHRYEQPGRALANIAIGVFGLVYVGMMLSFAVQVRLYFGIGAVAAWILSVKMGDIGAYTVGRLFGRHKMAPRVSPGKTVEGAFGAFLFAIVGSWIGFHLLIPLAPPDVNLSPGSHYGWLIFGVLMGGIGMIGDLAESLLKRDAGCKDSSNWMPGFGGVLDILDSLLLTAPVVWLLWSLGIVGPGNGG